MTLVRCDGTGKGERKMSENKIDNVDEVLDVKLVSNEDGSKISEEELDGVVGGAKDLGLKVDYYLTCYCPYHRKTHGDMIKLKGGFGKNGGALFPAYYCLAAGRPFFRAANGYYDQRGRMLVEIKR